MITCKLSKLFTCYDFIAKPSSLGLRQVSHECVQKSINSFVLCFISVHFLYPLQKLMINSNNDNLPCVVNSLTPVCVERRININTLNARTRRTTHMAMN